jgi:hypothetical protein
MYFYKKLKAKQVLAINVLSMGGTKKQAAETANVTLATIDSWYEQVEFLSAIEEKTNEFCDQVYRKIIAASNLATKTLIDIINDENTKDRDKITASCKILDLALKRQDYLLMKKIELLQDMYGDLEGDDFDVPVIESAHEQN